MRQAWGLLCLLSLAACGARPNPHYELGHPYQVRGTWFYPSENFTLDETGLAAVYGGGHASLTADGERFDPSVAMVGHPTIQLPAVARLTNLENGRSMVVRIADRGAGDPARFIDVTPRTAVLLGMRTDGATRMRLQVLPEESHAASDPLPGHPALAIAAAPRDAVIATDLMAPPGAATATPPPREAAPAIAPVAIARLPETVTQGAALPGRLWVRLDAFEEYPYATAQRARVADLGATIDRIVEKRVRRFRVQIGPLDTVQQADAALRAALARGIPDAHIVVE